MKNFIKVVRLGVVSLGSDLKASLYCKIEYKDGKLSITGVEGPKRNGDCKGSCGQIVMSDWNFESLAPGWDAATVSKFREVWNEWHLNDLTPNCEHQVGPDWTSRDVSIYHYRLKSEIIDRQNKAKNKALKLLAEGQTVACTQDELEIIGMPLALEQPDVCSEDQAKYYEPRKSIYAGDKGFIEVKKTGWLRESEHPAGFLGKACPVCGYKYGTAWLKREVPEDVLEFLAGLPVTDVKNLHGCESYTYSASTVVHCVGDTEPGLYRGAENGS